ncbi:unnamed protein product [Moneuplotes crassus]|uniref:Uncharacterized protein n=1 Tax=Euplotes crassus TaxID=5936 RepID=A0AAD1XWB6_EUPCR|nr:unnamed protein product [Moneuplotes crassus]
MERDNNRYLSVLVPGKVSNPLNAISAIKGTRMKKQESEGIEFEVPLEDFEGKDNNLQLEIDINRNAGTPCFVKLRKKRVTSVLMKVKKQPDNICNPIFHDTSKGDIEDQLLTRFDHLIDSFSKNIKTNKLIEDVDLISRNEVLSQSVEKEELEKAIIDNGLLKDSANTVDPDTSNTDAPCSKSSHKKGFSLSYDYMHPY